MAFLKGGSPTKRKGDGLRQPKLHSYSAVYNAQQAAKRAREAAASEAEAEEGGVQPLPKKSKVLTGAGQSKQAAQQPKKTSAAPVEKQAKSPAAPKASPRVSPPQETSAAPVEKQAKSPTAPKATPQVSPPQETSADEGHPVWTTTTGKKPAKGYGKGSSKEIRCETDAKKVYLNPYISTCLLLRSYPKPPISVCFLRGTLRPGPRSLYSRTLRPSKPPRRSRFTSGKKQSRRKFGGIGFVTHTTR
jgi:hypothetical protein